jgi:phage antirepressor YoqD-like protein
MLPLAGAPLTMSSREIAELVESRHDSVKLTIERLAARGVIALPPLVEVPSAGPGPRLVGVYHLGKRDSYVVVAQLSPEFTGRLVDRWQELEAQQRAAALVLPRTFAEALRLAADQAEQLERQRPAVEFVGRFVDSAGLMGVRQVAKLLKANERDFVAWLEERGIMYRLAGRLTPMARHMDAGRFEVKTGSADNGHAYAAARFTPKGVQWIAGEWSKHLTSASTGAR